MKPNFDKYLLFACMTFMPLSCEQKLETPELPVPAVLAMQDSDAEPKRIELYDSGTTSTASVEFRVVAEAISGSTLNVTFKSDASKVDAFNQANGTDYMMAPAECFDLTEAKVMLPRYNTVSSTARVSVSTNGIPDSQTYILPITIARIEGDENVTVDTGKDVVYVIIKKYVLKDPVLLDRSDWEVIYCSSQGAEKMYNGYPYGPASLIFDNEINSWWNYDTSDKAPFYLVIDMKREQYVKKIILTARPDTGDNSFKTRGAPRNVDFAFATTVNGTGADAMEGDYSDYEVFTDLEQFRSRLNFKGEITLGGLYYSRYIMVRYNGAWKNSDSGAPDYISDDGTYNVAMLAEFEAAGYTDSPYE